MTFQAQLSILDLIEPQAVPAAAELQAEPQAPAAPDLASYDYFIVAFSGGKDSLASLLHLLDQGVDKSKIELWHHDIDGREGGRVKMDWPVTPAYVRAVGAALDLPVYFSWKVGGFSGELLRENERTQPIRFETPEGQVVEKGGTAGKLATRRRFPQVSADLTTRWCSGYLKIDVAARAITNQDRFNGKRTLFITGERAEESAGRAKYLTFEPHRTDRRDGRLARHVDHWRPIHAWPEWKVWQIIQAHGVRPHPAYELGWGRLSCMTCIFGSANQWASVRAVAPQMFETIAEAEAEFETTIHRKMSVREQADAGEPYPAIQPDLAGLSLQEHYDEQVLIEPAAWQMPAGAFGESCGPT